MSIETTTPAPVVYYVAKHDLKIGGVNAFAAGDNVPESTVNAQGWQDSVERAETKAGKPTAAADKIRATASAPAETPATA